jgi:hypothetical protein
MPGPIEPRVQFLQGFGPAPIKHGQEARPGQDPDLIHVTQQGCGSLEGIQAGQFHAPAPRAQAAENRLCLQQVAETGQIHHQGMHFNP